MNKAIAILALLALTACSESEHDKSERLIKEQQAKQGAQEEAKPSPPPAEESATATAEQTQPAPAEEPTAPAEPETPPKPEYRDVTHYIYQSDECKCIAIRACGVSIWKCDRGKDYDCMHNVATAKVTRNVQVTKSLNEEENCDDE